jgi:hypothetical protein
MSTDEMAEDILIFHSQVKLGALTAGCGKANTVAELPQLNTLSVRPDLQMNRTW